MNAGAYGGEMSNVLMEVKVLCPDGSIKWKIFQNLTRYRKSNILANNEIVMAAKIKLAYGNRDEIRAQIEDLNNRRNENSRWSILVQAPHLRDLKGILQVNL